MSNDLEAIVRPSQTLDYAPARVYHNPGQVGVPNTVLRIGRTGGEPKVLRGSLTANASFYMTQYSNEKEQASFGSSGSD